MNATYMVYIEDDPDYIHEVDALDEDDAATIIAEKDFYDWAWECENSYPRIYIVKLKSDPSVAWRVEIGLEYDPVFYATSKPMPIEAQ